MKWLNVGSCPYRRFDPRPLASRKETKMDNGTKVDLAYKFWLETGQYADQDAKLYPKDIIKEAFNAGMEIGLLLGKKASQQGFSRLRSRKIKTQATHLNNKGEETNEAKTTDEGTGLESCGGVPGTQRRPEAFLARGF